MNNEVQLNVEEILRFFDERKPENEGHVSSIIALVGEDLGAGLFQHYLRTEKCCQNVKILEINPKGEEVRCSLDRWIYCEYEKGKKKCLFQTEIKNWSVYAIGGDELEVDASDKVIKEFAIDRWKRYNEEFFKPQTTKDKKKRDKKEENAQRVLKVFRKMKSLDIKEYKDVSPMLLLILWVVIHPESKRESYFQHSFRGLPCKSDIGNKMYFFSMSSYLRSLRNKGISEIKIEMPNFVPRIKLIKKLFSYNDKE